MVTEQAELSLMIRRDMPDKRELHSRVRQGIETLFSQLWHRLIDLDMESLVLGIVEYDQAETVSYNLRHCGIVSA